MARSRFWKLVDQARSGTKSDAAFIQRITYNLRGLSAEQVAEFAYQFETLRRTAYRWDLWGAAYLALGGCSDDGFDYFRAWLISQGQSAFEKVTRTPDSLAALPRAGELEDLMHVAPQVYKEKTGREIPPSPTAPGSASGPSGAKWDFDDPVEMKRRYPKLFAKYGS